MSRWVVPQEAGLKAGTKEKPDGSLGRIVKYVPVEVVTAFTMLFSGLVTLKPSPEQGRWAAVGLIVLFLLVTIAYVTTHTKGKVRKAHLLVSPLAFLAWSYPIASALLGDFFIGLVAFAAQAIVIALSIYIKPRVS